MACGCTDLASQAVARSPPIVGQLRTMRAGEGARAGVSLSIGTRSPACAGTQPPSAPGRERPGQQPAENGPLAQQPADPNDREPVARVYLHSGGLSPAAVRTGTGGRKASQWRTGPPPSKVTVRASTCQRCVKDRHLVDAANKFFSAHGQPDLGAPYAPPPGTPGVKMRAKAVLAAGRTAACQCQKKPVPTKAVRSSSARGRTTSTDPRQQVLAFDRATRGA